MRPCKGQQEHSYNLHVPFAGSGANGRSVDFAGHRLRQPCQVHALFRAVTEGVGFRADLDKGCFVPKGERSHNTLIVLLPCL